MRWSRSGRWSGGSGTRYSFVQRYSCCSGRCMCTRNAGILGCSCCPPSRQHLGGACSPWPPWHVLAGLPGMFSLVSLAWSPWPPWHVLAGPQVGALALLRASHSVLLQSGAQEWSFVLNGAQLQADWGRVQGSHPCGGGDPSLSLAVILDPSDANLTSTPSIYEPHLLALTLKSVKTTVRGSNPKTVASKTIM